jgi:hypothetical protein
MERIILEVDDQIARAWRSSPASFREEMEKDLTFRITQKVREAERDKFFQYLDKVQESTAQKGLTQEALEKLLNEKD